METVSQMQNEKVGITQRILSVKIHILLIWILITTLIGIVAWQYTLNTKISEGLKGVYITDITDRSAVVSWVTSQPIETELLYSEEKLDSPVKVLKANKGYDRRDLEEVDELEYRLKKRGKYYVHSVLLRDLSPETEYHFAIKNGLFLNKSVYIDFLNTTKEFEQVDSPEIAYGNVMNQDGELISDTLLIFEITNENDDNKSQQVSYVMDGNTGWSVNIKNLLDSNLEQEYIKDTQSYLGMYIINASGETSNIFDYEKVKPAENYSAYDNNHKESDTEVKGLMALACECTTCSPQCPPGGYHFSSCDPRYNCVTERSTCKSRDSCTGEVCETIRGATCYKETTLKQTCVCESCTPYCPTNYTFSCPSGWNCTTMNSVCEKYDSCTGDRCGTQSGDTCYKPVSKKEECSCPACQPKCPEDFHFEPCEEGYNCSTAHSTCTQKDSCTGQRCGPISTQGPICYKETSVKTQEPVEETPESCVKKYDDAYAPGQFQSYFWCTCSNPAFSGCVGARVLLNSHSSSCRKYCESKQNSPVREFSQCKDQKNLIDKEGKLIICEYGCQDNGEDDDDICKSKPSEIGQEVDCSIYKDMSSCRWADGDCEWSFANQICTTSDSASVNCSSISSQSVCNSKSICEFKDSKCQEINLLNYRRMNEDADYCSGVRDKDGNVISISYGPDTIPTHRGKSQCSIDLNATGVNLGNQIAGFKINPVTKEGEWANGYTCKVASQSELGYGNSIIVKQPDGTEIRYAHLKYASCDNVITGNSGGYIDPVTGQITPWGYHLHVEVECATPEECASCTGEKNPCRAIAGGCFDCEDTVKAQAIFGEDYSQIQSNNKSFLLSSFISKIKAEEIEDIDPAILIKDLELPDGKYVIKSAAIGKTTDFIKTENNQIVFFEDANRNNKLDNGEAILSPYEAQIAYQVTYEKTADSYELTLQEGYNLVSFPIIFKNDKEEEIKKASELIEYLNNGGANITTIATYAGGQFITYVQREGKEFGDDFNILPGKGYFVKSLSKGSFLYSGIKVKDGLEILLYEGWNLVNIYNSNVHSYSGFQLLKQMKEQSVGADMVTKWEDGKYTGIVSEEGGDYGIDFKLYQNRGYFVRVKENGGPFTPK